MSKPRSRWQDLLADPQFKHLSGLGFPDAYRQAGILLDHYVDGLPKPVRDLLPSGASRKQWDVSQQTVNALDSRYFELEELGATESAAEAFAAARILSAHLFIAKAASFEDLMEALYEAFHSQSAARETQESG